MNRYDRYAESGEFDYQTHVFTSTYTADVSGVCSAMYELGGMTILHDPSGCNSTYSTHDEPRWFDTDSLMFVSGLDEITAVLGDDNVLIEDVALAASDLQPRFITLCGGAIPHITAFDYKGVARLIEKRTGVPTIPVVTNGNRSYVAGVGAALTAWVKRFGRPEECPWRSMNTESRSDIPVNILGSTPLDFSTNGNIERLRALFPTLNCCAAMGESFDSLTRIYRGAVNVVVSSAGRRLARYMQETEGTPYVEGVPIGKTMTDALLQNVQEAYWNKLRGRQPVVSSQNIRGQNPVHDRCDVPEDQILVIGEEIFAQSLAAAINALDEDQRFGCHAYPVWPDVDCGLPEHELAELIRKSEYIIADPLYKVIPHDETKNHFIDFPHEAYSGRIYRKQIPLFVGPEFSVEKMLQAGKSASPDSAD